MDHAGGVGVRAGEHRFREPAYRSPLCLDPDRPFRVPQILNIDHGVFVVENLNLAQLATDGVRRFALILTHPKLRGATGAWTSPIALI